MEVVRYISKAQTLRVQFFAKMYEEKYIQDHLKDVCIADCALLM